MIARLFNWLCGWIFGKHHLPGTVERDEASKYILRQYRMYQDSPYTAFYVDLLYYCENCKEVVYRVYDPHVVIIANLYSTSLACNCPVCGDHLEPTMYRDIIGFETRENKLRRLANGLWVKY